MAVNPYKKFRRESFEPNRLPKTFWQDFASWADSSFQARGLAEVYRVWRDMMQEKKILIFLGYSGSLSSAGFWPGIVWLIKNRFIDVLVSTGANISEDVFEAMGKKYYKVDPWFPDDADLLEHKMDRFYDHAADEYDYRDLEALLADFIREWNAELTERTVVSTVEFLHRLGVWLGKKDIWSITAVAAKAKVPVFCPALVDSGYGEAYIRALHSIPRAERKLIIEQFWDAEQIFEIAEWGRKRGYRKGAGYIGGGVPKDFTQLVSVSQALMEDNEKVFPFDYSFQITTDSPQWGGLSGCGVMTEPISWGKQGNGGRNAQAFVDATIALRLILRAFKEEGLNRRAPPDLGWFFNGK
ncbi:MAG: deoxyhypusine synthase family protein [Patescibacteria group bacterium]